MKLKINFSSVRLCYFFYKIEYNIYLERDAPLWSTCHSMIFILTPEHCQRGHMVEWFKEPRRSAIRLTTNVCTSR